MTIQADMHLARTAARLAKSTCRRILQEKHLHWPYQKLTVAFFARAIRAADAAILLAESGLAEDAAGITRTVFELLQHVAFINIDNAQRHVRTKCFFMEGILDTIEDAEFTRLSYEMQEVRIPRDRSLRQMRKMVLDELESQKRWRHRDPNEKLVLLQKLWGKLEPKTTSDAVMRALDHVVRTIGNRHVHVRPDSLNSVITSQQGYRGRREFSVTYKPPKKGPLPILKAVRILMLAFSQTMALLFYHKDDQLPIQIGRALDSLTPSTNLSERKEIGRHEAQQDYSRRSRIIQEMYRQTSAMRE
jgi:predicted amino acid-binding ACT domain protein